ncbi:MAG: TadE/TadG family type IV pilus assembly protein [Paracoccaceae bacterium]
MMERPEFRSAFSGFLREESGVGTVFGLFLMVTVLMLGGLALDSTSARMARNQLQTATDASALAAAARMSDLEIARAAALQLAQLNLGGGEKNPIGSGDIVFGIYDLSSGSFTETDDDPNAVKVVAKRSSSRGNAVGTYLMKLVGVQSMDVTTVSVALESNAPLMGKAGVCEDTLILTTAKLNGGGDNTMAGSVCLHGQMGVVLTGNDLIPAEARLSAPEWVDIETGALRHGSSPAARIKMARSLEPALLPAVEPMIDALWAALWDEGVDAAARGDLAADGTTDHILIPDFVKASGSAAVVMIDAPLWNVVAGDLAPNTVYLASGDVVLNGAVSAQDVAIIAQGEVEAYGDDRIAMNDVAIMARGRIGFSGKTSFGNAETYCDADRYNSYLLSQTAVTLSGAGSQSTAHGLVVAAPEFSAGTSLRNSGGIYVEADEVMSLGGHMNLGGCGFALASAYEITRPTEQVVSNGSFLVN